MRNIIVVGAVLCAWVQPALADPPAPDIGAACAVTLDPATNAFLYTHQPDRLCWTGSTAKTVTIDVAIRAYRSGYVGLGDIVPFSEDATEQACTCLGTYSNDTAAAQDHPDTIAVPGEKLSLNKSLFGADMSAVEPTVSLAEYVGNAEVHGVKQVGQSHDESESLRLDFVGLMNDLFSAMGLHDSHFANEHGGAEGLGTLPPPKSTAREMAEFWAKAAVDPLFIKYTGLRNVPVTTTRPNGTHRHYTLTKWYGYYPSILGDKEGGVQPPDEPAYTSLLGSSKRLGRTLIFDVMEDEETDGNPAPNEFTDAAEVLRYGFAKIFDPDRRGDSGSAAGAAADQGLSCWSNNRCVTAVRTGSNTLKLIAWRTKVGGQTVSRLGDATGAGTNIDEVDVTKLGGVNVCKTGDGGGPPKARTANLKGCKASERVVTAEVAGGNAVLRSWNVVGNNRPVALHDSGKTAVAGTHIALRRLGPHRLVSAVIQADGTLRLDTWTVSAKGVFTQLDTDVASAAVHSFQMTTTRTGNGVAAELLLDGTQDQLIYWGVGSAGTLTRTADTLGKGTGYSAVGIARTGPNEYMTSTVSGGKVSVAVYDLATDLSAWTQDGDMTSLPPVNASEVVMKRLGAHAALLAVSDDGKLGLYPIQYDTRYEHDPYGGHSEQYYALGAASAGGASDVDLDALDTNVAVGDFVTALRTTSGNLKLINWRVGKKP